MEEFKEKKPEFSVTGTLIWYYFCCPREVWLMVHQINPDEDNTDLDLGRFIQETTYIQDRQKEIEIGNIKLDIVRKDSGGIVVGEVKKSSRFLKSARMQLAFYLFELKERGVTAKGQLLFPKEKKKEDVVLNKQTEQDLALAVENIRGIAIMNKPPPPVRIRICANCAYKELCWA
jgi:CRISPR-associated exonuclease Cas4